MKLSVVIPARNEEGAVPKTVSPILHALHRERIPFEIIVVDDGSTDATARVVTTLGDRHPEIRLVQNTGRHGFGMAVRRGLTEVSGDAVAVVMADGSDSPDDVVKCCISKLKIREMGSRYLFIVLYVWLEKHLARGDYHRQHRGAEHAVGLDVRHV